jgi:hypothetical protein
VTRKRRRIVIAGLAIAPRIRAIAIADAAIHRID